MINSRYLLTVLSIMLLNAGCTTGFIKDTGASIDEQTVKTEQAKSSQIKRAVAKPRNVAVSQTSGAYLPLMTSEIKSSPSPALTKSLAINRSLASLSEAAERIIALTGIPVYISSDITESTDSTLSSTGSGAALAGPAPDLSGGTSEIGLPPAGGSAPVSTVFDVNYNGTMAGFLDVLAAHYNVSWEEDDGVVTFFKYKTAMFIIKTVPGDTTSVSDIKPSSGGLGSSSSSSSSRSTSALTTKVDTGKLSIWDDIESAVEGMLSNNGSSTISPSIGTLTVTDTPRTLQRVKRFIDEQNRHLSRQVAVKVQVLAVTMTNDDNYGVNWNLVNQDMAKSLGLSYAGGGPLTVGNAALTIKKLATGTVLNDGQTVKNGSDLQGSTAFIQALSKQAKVSSVTNVTEITLNNQPVPVHVGHSQSYLASSSTTPSVTAGVAPTTTLTPGSVSTGFTMNVLPHIQDNDSLILQYSLDISSLLGLNTVSSGGSSIQTPNLETRRILQRVYVTSGETLVLSGYEVSDLRTDQSGVGDPNNTLLGGNTAANKTKTMIVILVTPTIVPER